MTDKRIVIIGAGPTGLGAGYRLKELGYKNFTIYERSSFLGGLASSHVDDMGFTWDIGGHVMFSHYEYYDQVFDKLMGDDYQLNMRESWVRMFDRWVPYPFQNNIRYLPEAVTYECIAGLIDAQYGRNPKEARNFDEFIDAVFGEGIAKYFMKPYNYKVWAHPAALMNKEWIGERVAIIDVKKAIKNVLLAEDDFGWGPNNQFKFPLRGGTGEFYRRFGPVLDDHIRLGKLMSGIDVKARQITFEDGEIAPYDILLSSIPLDVLCTRLLHNQIDAAVEEAAASLRHSGGCMVGVGFKQPCPSTKSWMYFPEENCPFYRVTYLSNYSPYMTPDNANYYSLLCETSYSKYRPIDKKTIIEQTITGLVASGMISEHDRKDIVTTWLYDAEYSYPIPTVDRDEILALAIPYLEGLGIYSRGRFGMWKYEVANTDHSLMQGVELIDSLLLGQEETTIGIKYASTSDGRQAAVHERALVAGSGDPRKPLILTVLSGEKQKSGNGRLRPRPKKIASA